MESMSGYVAIVGVVVSKDGKVRSKYVRYVRYI